MIWNASMSFVMSRLLPRVDDPSSFYRFGPVASPCGTLATMLHSKQNGCGCGCGAVILFSSGSE